MCLCLKYGFLKGAAFAIFSFEHLIFMGRRVMNSSKEMNKTFLGYKYLTRNIVIVKQVMLSFKRFQPVPFSKKCHGKIFKYARLFPCPPVPFFLHQKITWLLAENYTGVIPCIIMNVPGLCFAEIKELYI